MKTRAEKFRDNVILHAFYFCVKFLSAFDVFHPGC